ncbi:hypothetical protein F4821DRAFT_259947 [Hypoxylon rubiginosum]|uniref:Uncharacterized protein n=1 Tax=Hypoxylon rubiginosum TaxID=110542 RepID=A0ACC0D1U9_9PEZI|nr:hypothetical protein F4821DRAFT_259947 [Hypoxylon rubiginosum]
MAQKENANVAAAADQDLRNALIRTNLALLQREIREKKDWYTTRRVVVRKRNGRIHLSRLGSRKQGSGSGYDSLDEASDEEESQSSSGFTLVNSNNESRSTGRSASSSFSSNFSR